MLKPIKSINIKGRLISLSSPIVMGILNVTPDSFYKGSRISEADILSKANRMIEDGASILDIGGYSTRPDAEAVSIDEEMARVLPAIRLIKNEHPESIISIDTFRSEVAREAIQSGADLINDVSGGSLDSKMFDTIAELQVPYVLMHMKGTPQTMQSLTDYEDILSEMLSYFDQKISSLREKGVKDIIIDLGFGFAKTLEQNYFLLRNLELFKELACPILVGVSRKYMIYKALDSFPKEALNGTSILNTIALQKGAKILRVHDVKEAQECVLLTSLTESL